MAGTFFTKKDRNRFRKVYPYLRKRESITYEADSEVVLETGSLTVTDAESASYNFEETFPSAPTITSTSVDSESNNSANINVFVSAVTTTGFTLNFSQAFTGKIHFHAIYIKE